MLQLAVDSLEGALISLMLVLGIGLLVLANHHQRLLSVQTASMLPAFRPGDAIMVRPVSIGQLRSGQVISYHSPRNPRVIISHRLVHIDKRTGLLTTAGDALSGNDPNFAPSLLVGQVTTVAPGLGRVLDMLRRPAGLLFAVYTPAIVIIGAELRRLRRSYARPLYSARLEA